MKYFLTCIGLVLGLTSFSQVITIYTSDSVPLNRVLVANLTMDESVFSNEKGEADLTIFQDEEENIQLIHQGFQTVIFPKYFLLKLGNIYLQKSSSEIALVEVSISAKTKESTYELITQSKSITKENIQEKAPGTVADMLEGTGQVQVQKSQLGGGSPILRGFEASRLLLVVDGVRMNNAIYRSGHLQNAISIDPNLLAGIEVVFGPNSLIYGSDALGGVIHFKTRNPKFKKDSTSIIKVDGLLRYQSALNAKVANINFQNGTERFAYFLGITRSEFGDLKMGSNRFHGFRDYGQIKSYVTRIDNRDTIMDNKNPNVVFGSGYEQTDLIWKGIYKANQFTNYKLNFQHSTTSNVPRVDKLNEYQNNELKFGDWHYGPQNRSLISLASESKKPTKLFNYNQTILAFQFIEEDRLSRVFQSDILEQNNEDVSVYSFNSDFIKFIDSTKKFKLNYGLEGLFNNVESSGTALNIKNQETGFLTSRYPGGGSTLLSVAAYLAVQKKIKNHLIKGGCRYTRAKIIAKFDTNEVVNLLSISHKSLISQAITSSLGYVYHKANYKLYSSISSAFKSPNVDDFGKIFEKKGDLTIPNPQLKPETSVNYEIGSNFISKYLDFDIAGYFTQVFNLMTKLPTFINGNSTLEVNNELLRLVSIQNSGTANIYGGFGAVRLKINERLNWYSTVTLTQGYYVKKNGFVGHIPPAYGKTSLSYKFKKLKLSVYSRFSKRKKWHTFNLLNDNPDEAVDNFGSPGWLTLNLSMFAYIYNDLKIQLSAENLMNTHYKTFASGISAPGRNFIASFYFKF